MGGLNNPASMTGAIKDIYFPSDRWVHPRWDTEYVGDATYRQKVFAFYELITEDITFNFIEIPVSDANATDYFKYKIYIRDTAAVFTPANETPVSSGVLTVEETNHNNGVTLYNGLQNIYLTTPVHVPKGKYLFIVVWANANYVDTTRWTVAADGSPARHGMMYSSNTTGGTALSASSGSSAYRQTTFKLSYVITTDDMAESEKFALIPDYTKGYTEISLPPKIYAVVGKVMNIYFDNLVADDISNYYVDVVCNIGVQYADRWTVTPDAAGSVALTINLYDRYTNLVKTASTTIVVALATANTGVSKTCLFIGDSLTAYHEYLDELYTNLMTPDAMDITLIGTQGTAPIIHEGYNSQTVYWHYADAESPFVFDDVFNFSSYMTTHSFASVDIVSIMLGTNDVKAASNYRVVSTVLGQNLPRLEAMITSIKTFNANAIIAICLPIPCSKSQDAMGVYASSGMVKWRVKRNFHYYAKGLSDYFDNREAENIYVVPTNVNLDTENNMEVTATAYNSRNSTTYNMQSDALHPATSGFNQMADTIYYWLKNLVFA